jgi:hypothetical protein
MEMGRGQERKTPSIGDFLEELNKRKKATWQKNREFLADSAFVSVGSLEKIHRGSFSDFLKLDLDAEIRIAEHLLEELRPGGFIKKENYEQEKNRVKFVAFCKKRRELLLSYAEAKDNSDTKDLAEVMESEMPFLKGVYEKYLVEFSTDSDE